MSSESKKQGFFSKLFSSSKENDEKKKSRSSSSSSSNPTSPVSPNFDAGLPSASKPQQHKHTKRTLSRKKTDKKQPSSISHKPMGSIDVSKPLEFPSTPETILAYHKKKPFLSRNEEWLIVELNEFECLVDSLEIIKTIASHSKFFEVEPDDLWQEFFEFVEDLSSYDDIINFDVWQEFRDQKYPC